MVDETGHEAIHIIGAATGGDSMTVVGSAGDTIIGSTIAGTSQQIDASNKDKDTLAGPETVIGGAGPTTVLAGLSDSILGGTGGMLISGGSHDTIIGGSGTITIQGGVDDSIVAGSGGIISVPGHGGGNPHDGFAADTIAAGNGMTFSSSGHGASTVMGFNTDTDTVQSANSVAADGMFLGTSTSTGAGTTLTFIDGSTMFIAGVTDMNHVKFTQ